MRSLPTGLLVVACLFSYRSGAFGQSIGTTDPEVEINVNREYDEDGNLIRFDSSYSAVWSSGQLPPDLMQQFNFMFGGAGNQFDPTNAWKGGTLPPSPFGSGFDALFDLNFSNGLGGINQSSFWMDSLTFDLQPGSITPFGGGMDADWIKLMEEQMKLFEQFFGPPFEPENTIPAPPSSPTPAAPKGGGRI